MCDWAESAILNINKQLPELPISGIKYKYEIKIEDIVNALNNLTDLVVEYFNLDNTEENEEDEGIDPENRHLGEPGLRPADSNEIITNEIAKSAKGTTDAINMIVAALRDLLSNMQDPQDVDDERILDPEAVKESEIEAENVMEGGNPPRTPPEALDDFDKKESATLEHREVLPGENNNQNPETSLVYDEGNPEPNPINQEQSNENDGPLQSSGEAYLSMPQDVKPEDEENEEEAKSEKTNSEQQSTESAEAESKKEKEEEINAAEDDEDEEEGGPGGENVTPAQVGWFQSKSIDKVAKAKGLEHYKSVDDGYISSKSMVSFSNFGKSSLEDYYPTDEELGEINANHSLVNMKKEDLIVIPIRAADMEVDRGGEHFTKDALESFVPLYKGKALLLDHNWTTDHEIGRIFDAKVVNDSLMVKAYIPMNVHNNKLINNILAGVHGRASVGFSMDIRNVTCDSCQQAVSRKGPPTQGPLESSGYMDSMTSIFDEDNCPHKPGAMDEYGNKTTVTLHKVADVMELSLVPVPMQTKSGTSRTLGYKSLDEKEQITISSNIISSRTNTGEKAVSDLTAPREGHQGEATIPPGAKEFDVEGNQHRATDDNFFAHGTLKNFHDVSENLKSLTADLVASQVALKAVLDEIQSMYAKAKPEMPADEDEEREEDKSAKVQALLEDATKALTEVLNKQMEQEKEKALPEPNEWCKTLVNDFNKSLGGTH